MQTTPRPAVTECEECGTRLKQKRNGPLRRWCADGCRQIAWNKAHPGYAQEYGRRWRREHPDYHAKYNRTYRRK